MRENNTGSGTNRKAKSLPAKTDKRDGKLVERNSRRNLKVKEGSAGPSSDKLTNRAPVRTASIGPETVDAFENVSLGNGNDAHVPEEDDHGTIYADAREDNKKTDNTSSDMEIVDDSDGEKTNGSVSSRRDEDDEQAQKVSSAPEDLDKNQSFNGHSPPQKSKSGLKQDSKLDNITSMMTANTLAVNLKNVQAHPRDLSELSNGQHVDSDQVVNLLNDTYNGEHVMRIDENAEKISKHENVDKRIDELETRIKNLESELREVAALELALYSVVPEHGGSAYKVHTPARRLSRLYMHSCKYWSQDKQASVARNIVSGLVLVSKSCGSDVSRLNFWLSNAVVLREILSQTWNLYVSKSMEDESQSSGFEKRTSSLKMSNGDIKRKQNRQRFVQLVDDWRETRTFTAALERVESWIFSRMVELIWWQSLTPNMQSPVDDSTADRDRLLSPSPGGQKQGDYSINLWKNAFHDAYKKLCPLRAGGHECGCLPVLARKVLEQCIGRLDVAMFNAVLRESAHEMPTDPVSDPILDPNVLPIPAGDLSFGSGAQLKNTVGNWSRWLSNFLGMDFDVSTKHENETQGADDQKVTEGPKCFPLLNELSDLLMLPKDLLMEPTVRMEVCRLISVPLAKRVLCNFSPDEFCPDPVPGAVLEALNAECAVDSSRSFPYTASPVMYSPPSALDVSENITEANTTPRLSHTASFIRRKGYTSDEELDELESCLTSVIGTVGSDDNNLRYDLLREVWKSA